MARIGKYERYRVCTTIWTPKKYSRRHPKRANKLQLEPLEASSEASNGKNNAFIV